MKSFENKPIIKRSIGDRHEAANISTKVGWLSIIPEFPVPIQLEED